MNKDSKIKAWHLVKTHILSETRDKFQEKDNQILYLSWSLNREELHMIKKQEHHKEQINQKEDLTTESKDLKKDKRDKIITKNE